MAEGRLSVERSVELAATPEKVWERIGSFGDMSWHPAMFSTDNPGGNAVGAVRVLTVGQAGGPTVTEDLLARSEEERRYRYRILEVDPAVLPVVNYTSEIAVVAADTGSRIVWRGAFDPAPGVTDAAASDAVAGVYAGGLEALAKSFAA
jgi:hypothetical protein